MTILPLTIEGFKLFPHEKTIGNINIIPDTNGIYAWYLNFSKFESFNSKEEFSKKLIILERLIGRDTLNGSVKSFFKRYNVELNEERVFLETFQTMENDGNIISGKKLSNLTLDDCRNLMTILAKFSMLVSPLYVGISNSLRRRWKEHKADFYEIKEMQKNGEDDIIIREIASKKFGGRVAYLDFNWDYLVFACVETTIDIKTIKEAEFLINRFYNPLLGKK